MVVYFSRRKKKKTTRKVYTVGLLRHCLIGLSFYHIMLPTRVKKLFGYTEADKEPTIEGREAEALNLGN